MAAGSSARPFPGRRHCQAAASVSVEAISWALNLAPVPRDGGGKPNPACKAVLIGLANHAGPDGKEAFPAVRTLIRYTCLSERTVQTALGRLEEVGIIRPCDPAVVAAKIKRADRRPQGWDLDMHLIRDDLDEVELAALERQFPGLTARVMAMRAANAQVGDGADHEVQQLHLVIETPVDDAADGVQPLRPAAATGCNHRANGVQLLRERGAAVAPEPSLKPPIEPSAARASARGIGPPAVDNPGPGGGGEFFLRLGRGWLLTDSQRRRLAPAVAAALAAGWAPAALAAFVGANTAGVRNPAAVLAARLSPAELPAPTGRACARPPWCGMCDERTRMLGYDGSAPERCLRCHPLAVGSTADAAWETGDRPPAGDAIREIDPTDASAIQTHHKRCTGLAVQAEHQQLLSGSIDDPRASMQRVQMQLASLQARPSWPQERTW
jgi:Helix-turn-helix domain